MVPVQAETRAKRVAGHFQRVPKMAGTVNEPPSPTSLALPWAISPALLVAANSIWLANACAQFS